MPSMLDLHVCLPVFKRYDYGKMKIKYNWKRSELKVNHPKKCQGLKKSCIILSRFFMQVHMLLECFPYFLSAFSLDIYIVVSLIKMEEAEN